MKIILASQSQRRREIFDRLKVPYTAYSTEADENVIFESPEKTVMDLALRKAAYAKNAFQDDKNMIIAADTLVYCGEQLLGKPKDEKDAEDMLKTLSGNSHEVYTGVCVMYGKGKTVFYEKSIVRFRKIDNDEIREYIKTGESMDKAGAYGIQNLGEIFVEGIEGDYFNIVGLPVESLFEHIKKEFGMSFFDVLKSAE